MSIYSTYYVGLTTSKSHCSLISDTATVNVLIGRYVLSLHKGDPCLLLLMDKNSSLCQDGKTRHICFGIWPLIKCRNNPKKYYFSMVFDGNHIHENEILMSFVPCKWSCCRNTLTVGSFV